MAPLAEAIRVNRKYVTHSGMYCYEGWIDPEWSSGSKKFEHRRPHGGYMCSILLNAALNLQSHQPQLSTPSRNENDQERAHPDPAYMSTQFFVAASVANTCEIHLEVVRKSKNWTWIDGSIIQSLPNQASKKILRSSLLFTKLSPLQPYPLPSSAEATPASLTVSPPCPLKVHPSRALPDPDMDHYGLRYQDRIYWGVYEKERKDDGELKRIAVEDSLPTAIDGSNWMKHGSWVELKDDGPGLTTATIPFFADMFENPGGLMPHVPDSNSTSWFATMVFTIEFKFPLSSLQSSSSSSSLPNWLHNPRTAGQYSYSRAVHRGRHDVVNEVWTSPGPISQDRTDSEKNPQDRWRERCVCLAVSNQMAITIDMGARIKAHKQRKEGKL